MTSRERIKAALAQGRALTVKGLAKAIDVDSLTSIAALCQQMTVDGTLSRTKDGYEPDSRGAVYLYKLASSLAAPVDASGTDSHGARPPSEDAQAAATAEAWDAAGNRHSNSNEAVKAAFDRLLEVKIAAGETFRKGPDEHPLRLAWWSDGSLTIARGAQQMQFERDEVEEIETWLNSMPG